MPAITGGVGVSHIYIDEYADIEKAINITHNSKVSKPSVCNALDTLLINANILKEVIHKLIKNLIEANVEIRCDKKTYKLLDQNNDNVVLEDSEVKFAVGETITGLISGATAKVLVDDVDDNKRLFITSNSQFILGETVNGSTSNSSGTIQTYRPNPVSSVQQLLNYTNVDATLYNFLDQFRDSFLEGIVDNLHESVDKRKLIKNIRDLYVAKGTKKGHELFFRLLLNETPQITYPYESMLRLSDGNWQVQNIIRAAPNTGLPSELVGVTIEGTSSNATGVVVSAISFIESGVSIVELELDENTQTGIFIENELIRGVSTVTESYVYLTI